MRIIVCLSLLFCFFGFSCQQADSLDWTVQTIDGSWRAGLGSGIAVDSNGMPQIGYEVYPGEMRYAYNTNSGWNTEHVSYASVGVIQSPSFALDHNDNPAVCYEENNICDLQYAYRNGGTWAVETVDSTGNTGLYNSMKFDNLNRPNISYFTCGDWQLRFARRDGGVWNTERVDTLDNDNPGSSLAIDSNGNPGIAYQKEGLSYAHWNGSKWLIETVDPGIVAWGSSVVYDQFGNPHISYVDYKRELTEIKYAYWNGNSWIKSTVETSSYSMYTSLALDSLGRPHIAYVDAAHYDQYVANWNGTSWTNDLVDVNGFGDPDISIGQNDRLQLSYYGGAGGNLMYATAVAPVPEPSGMAVFLTGTMGLLGALRSKRRQSPRS